MLADWVTTFKEFFIYLFDAAFIFQIVCVSLGSVLALGGFKLSIKPLLFRVISFALLFGVTVLSTSLFSTIGNWDLRSYMIILGLLLPGVIYLIFFNKGKWSQNLIKILLFISACYVVTEISHYTNLLSNSLESTGLKTFIRFLPHVLTLACCLLIGLFDINKSKDVTLPNFILSIFVFLFLFAVTFLVSKITDPNQYLEIIVLFILVFFLSTETGIYIVLVENMKLGEEMLELEAQAKLNESAYEMLKLNEESIARTTILRHDLKNHYAYINNLLQEEKYQEAKDYISSINDEDIGGFHIVDCGNRVISSIMNLELSKARMKNIEIKYLLAIPSTLPFKETRLCSLITNIIDNALEGFSPTEDNKFIDVKMFIKDGYFRMSVSNPTNSENMSNVSKKKGKGHGYGIKIIKRIVKHYHGFYRANLENKVYTVEVMLEM